MSIFTDEGLLREEVYSLTVNGRILASASLFPEKLEEFAKGYLITEGLIPLDEIESVMMDKTAISVLTKNPFKVLLSKRSVISGCGGTASYLDPTKLPRLEDDFSIDENHLRVCFDPRIENAGGFFAAAVSFEGKILGLTSCLSQYSAVSKTIGEVFGSEEYALICSGKITADLVRKVLNAKVPILASYQNPTDLSVKIAEKGGLTLVKLPEKIIFTHKKRINTDNHA